MIQTAKGKIKTKMISITNTNQFKNNDYASVKQVLEFMTKIIIKTTIK